MHVETILIAILGRVTEVIGSFIDPYAILYALIFLVIIPMVGFVASQACAAIIGHYALRLCMGQARKEMETLERLNRSLQDQNCRLMATNALHVGEHERLRRENRRHLKRALKAELALKAPGSRAA